MEEAEALADSFRAPKLRQLMTASEDNIFSGSFGSSNILCSLQGLKPKEEESLQINTMQDEDIAKLFDWGSESGEISNGQSFVITTEDNLVLDDHQIALLFSVDDDEDNNNTNKNPTVASCSWENLPGIC